MSTSKLGQSPTSETQTRMPHMDLHPMQCCSGWKEYRSHRRGCAAWHSPLVSGNLRREDQQSWPFSPGDPCYFQFLKKLDLILPLSPSPGSVQRARRYTDDCSYSINGLNCTSSLDIKLFTDSKALCRFVGESVFSEPRCMQRNTKK